MGYLALFVVAVLIHASSARSWRGYDDYHYNRPSGNHHNFDYNAWCHRPGGWNGNWGSWEDSGSSESQEWSDSKDRDKLTRSTTTKRSVVIDTTKSDGSSSISIRLSPTGSTQSTLDVMRCLKSCPITSEYNPVCGTDNITYINLGRLQCAISCGIDVALKRPYSCPADDSLTQSSSPVPTTMSPQVLATCMRSCPVTAEYNPICGTDFLTYTNPSRLECAKGCGKPVSVLMPSRCPPPDQITTTTTTTTTAAPSSSTSTTEASTASTTTSNPTTTPNVTPSTTTRFTLSHEVLEDIFNQKTTNEPVPDFSLDERYE